MPPKVLTDFYASSFTSFLPGLPLHLTLAKHMQLASADGLNGCLAFSPEGASCSCRVPATSPVPTANERARVMGLQDEAQWVVNVGSSVKPNLRNKYSC